MSASPGPTVPEQQPPSEAPPPTSSKRIKIAAAVAAALVLLGGGFAAGYASGRSPIHGYQRQIAQASRHLHAEKLQLNDEKLTLQSEQGQVRTAQANAKKAMSAALAQVRALYKSKLAAVQSLQRKLQHEQGIVLSSTISADGVYVVGKDIPSGTYHTSGGAQCYFATLGSTDTNNILDNNNFNGPETVDVSGAFAFQISGGCTWVKV